LRTSIHRDECACVVSVSDVLCNSQKKNLHYFQTELEAPMVLDQSGPALEKYLGKNLRPSALVNPKSRWRKLFQFTAPQRSPPGGRQKGVGLRFPSYTKESKSSFIRRRRPRALSPVQRLCSAPCRRLWTRIRLRLQLLRQLRVWAPVTWSRP
jgi:hypothetical protein